MDKTKLNLERLRAYDAEWEEDKHPRADNGQFTSGGGSAGGKLKPEESEAPKSPLRQAAAIVQGTSNTGFNFSPRKKQLTMNILQRDIDNFGSSSPIGKVNTSLLNDLKNGKSFTEAINNAKAKYKGKGDEYDSQLYDFYVTSKGPQGNENFVKEYGSKGSDYRSQKKALEREAEAWLES